MGRENQTEESSSVWLLDSKDILFNNWTQHDITVSDCSVVALQINGTGSGHRTITLLR